MIECEMSAELNGMTEDELRARFVRYPQSNKKVVAVCDVCGKVRTVKYQRYFKLCHRCSQRTDEARKANSLRCVARYSKPSEREAARARAVKQFSYLTAREAASARSVEQFSTQEARDDASVRSIQYHTDHPEAKEAARSRGIEQFSTQESRDEMSEIMKRSPAHKTVVEKMVGGDDIVGHHMIYDHSDLTKNIMYMTRSMHTMLHRLFQKHGIDIPHINRST